MANPEISSDAGEHAGTFSPAGTFLAGLALLIYCVWKFVELAKLDAALVMQIGGGLPSDAYPKFLTYGLLLCGTVLTLSGGLAMWRQRRSLPKAWRELFQPIVLFLVQLSLFVFFFERLGFLLSSSIFMVGLNWWISGRFRLSEAGVTLVVVALLMVILRITFDIVLPTGSWLILLARG